MKAQKTVLLTILALQFIQLLETGKETQALSLLAKSNNIDFTSLSKDGNNALHLAAIHGSSQLIDRLLKLKVLPIDDRNEAEVRRML